MDPKVPRTKRCWKCGEDKPLGDFHRDKSSKDGRLSRCKVCTLKYRRERSALTKDYDLQRHYGISLAEYDEILEAQRGVCAICGRTPEESSKQLSVDHDHETDEVRGLLCFRCNIVLGEFQSNPELFRAAAEYLQKKSSHN